MEWTLEVENIKKERFSSSNVHKFHKSTVFFILTKWGPIDMVLIPRMNKTSFPFEIQKA
jgi:hypothetical protein